MTQLLLQGEGQCYSSERSADSLKWWHRVVDSPLLPAPCPLKQQDSGLCLFPHPLLTSGATGKHYLMVSESDVPREYGCQPVAPQFDIDALGQLLQGGQVAGLEVVSQGHVQLLLMRLHMCFWKRRSQEC